MSEKITEINKREVNEMKLKLSKEYDFEGQKISEIDLSGLDNLTAADMIQANKVLTNNGTVSVLPETTLEYDLIIAAGALKMPIEFFKQLKPKDAMALKNRVTSFYSERNKSCGLLRLAEMLPNPVAEPQHRVRLFLQMNIFDLIDLCADLKEVTPKK